MSYRIASRSHAMRQPTSNSPQNDRGTYITQTATGYEGLTGARVSSAPVILMACYVSISSALAATIFVQFHDLGAGDAVQQVLVPSWTACSEPLATPSGTFVWTPGEAEEIGYQDPITRDPCGRQPILGFPFDRGLIVIASGISNGYANPAADLIRVTCRVRYPAGYGGGL